VPRGRAILLVAALLLLAPDGVRAGPAREDLLAGAARRAITPSGPVWMAGYGVGPVRRSRGREADLHVRALALSRGERVLVLVSADLVGLFREDVEAVRARVARAWREGEPPAVVIACTHTHAGPDTLGLWGGISRSYREFLREQMALAVLEALEAREAVGLTAVTVPAPGRAVNRRDPSGRTGEEIIALRLYGAGGTPVATLVGFASHPTLLGPANHFLSADFPGYLAARLEERAGGVVLYFTGANGDQSPLWSGGTGFDVPRGYGEALADLVEARLRLHAASDPAAGLDFAWRTVAVPVTNWRMALAWQLGLVARQSRRGMVETEVWFIRLGPAYLATLPGEALAAVGERLRAAAGGSPFLLLGLANDALGYLVPAAEWRAGGYEESLASSPVAADLLADEVLQLAAEVAGWEPPAAIADPAALAGARAAAWRLAVFIRSGVVAALVILLAVFTGIAWTVQAGGATRQRPPS